MTKEEIFRDEFLGTKAVERKEKEEHELLCFATASALAH